MSLGRAETRVQRDLKLFRRSNLRPQIHQTPFNPLQADHLQPALVFVLCNHNVGPKSFTHLANANAPTQGSASVEQRCACSLPLPLYSSRYQQAKRDQLHISHTQSPSENPRVQPFCPSSEDTTPTNQLHNPSPKQMEQPKPNMATTR